MPTNSRSQLAPGPKPRYPLQHLIAFRNDRLAFLRLMACFGDVSHVSVRGQHFYLVNHPDLIRDVLVTHSGQFIKSRALQVSRRLLGNGLLTSEGDFHLRQRRLAQPAFHRQRVAAFGDIMVRCAARTTERWHALGDGATVDMAAEMMRLTLAIAGKTLFGADVEEEAPDIGRALTETLHAFNRLLMPGGELLEKLPLAANRRAVAAQERLDGTIYRMIEARRAGEDTGDLLSTLLLAQDDEHDGARMTDRQVRDEAMTIFLAGHETTANALSWTWYLLSQHRDAEARLHEELDGLLGGRRPAVADLLDLTYTRAVLSESIRLFPPAYVMGRQPIQDYEMRGYVVPAGSTLFLSPYVMHRDRRFWREPERFLPERWTSGEQAGRPRFAYFPFGGGPRICIGEGFAWQEGILVLATLAQQWQARLVPGYPVDWQPLITLRPKHGIAMTLQRRKGDRGPASAARREGG